MFNKSLDSGNDKQKITASSADISIAFSNINKINILNIDSVILNYNIGLI